MVMMWDTEHKKTKQTKISINFRDTDIDKKIWEYCQEKGKVVGVSNAIKQIIAEKMEQEDQGSK